MNKSDFIDNNLKSSKLNNMRVFEREFEAFSLGIIDNLLKSQNKSELNRSPNFSIIHKKNGISIIQVDAVSPDGINKLKGPTLIEIKAGLNLTNLGKLLDSFSKLGDEYNSGIIIFDIKLSKKDKDYINSKIKSRAIDLNIEIWDYDDISNLANEFNEESIKLINNIGHEVFNHTIEQAKKSSDDWKEERKNQLLRLKKSYKNDEIVLMIEAGTSKDAGVSNWNELLKDLNLSIINQNLSSKLTEIEKNEFAEGLVNYKMERL